jgi:hypothetical protein
MPKEAKMITHAELQQLIDFEPTGHPVLSLYLNVDPSRRSKDKYMLWLRNHLKEVSDQADQADIERVERYFGFEYDWQGKSVASFACAEAGLWQAFPLAVPMEDGIFVGDLPHIKPLTDLMDRYEPYGVALVDREGSRLFQIHMGQIVGTAGTLGEETKRHKQGGWAAQKLQRHEDVQASHNLRSAANAAIDFFQQGQSRRIILAGTEETVSQFHNLLPRAWQERVVGTLPMDMNAPDNLSSQKRRGCCWFIRYPGFSAGRARSHPGDSRGLWRTRLSLHPMREHDGRPGRCLPLLRRGNGLRRRRRGICGEAYAGVRWAGGVGTRRPCLGRSWVHRGLAALLIPNLH